MIQILNEKFDKVFKQYFEELNTQVVKRQLQEEGYFEVSIPVLSDGGATVANCSKALGAFDLDAPAGIKWDTRNMEGSQVVYRIVFGGGDATKAAEDDTYFNYLITPIVKEAVERYQKTFGSYKNIRYGKAFCTPYGLTSTKPALVDNDSGDVELRLQGCWAGNKEYVEPEVETIGVEANG